MGADINSSEHLIPHLLLMYSTVSHTTLVAMIIIECYTIYYYSLTVKLVQLDCIKARCAPQIGLEPRVLLRA